MTIPREILAQLEFLCESHNHGMLVVQGEEFSAIVMGDRKWSPDQISIVVSFNLLRGVISSELNAMNDETNKRREEERKM
jgi:hypothetical protein